MDKLANLIELRDFSHEEGDTYEKNEDSSTIINRRTQEMLEALSTDIVEESFATMESCKPLIRSNAEILMLGSEAIGDLEIIATALGKNIDVTFANAAGVIGTVARGVENDKTRERVSIKAHISTNYDHVRFFAHIGAFKDKLDDDLLALLEEQGPNQDTNNLIDALANEVGGTIFLPRVKPVQGKDDEDNQRKASINLSERQFIAIAEPVMTLKDMRYAKGNFDLQELDPKEAKELEDAVFQMRLRHEVLHALGVGQMFPEYLREGIVQRYTTKTLNEFDKFPGLRIYAYTKNMGAVDNLESILIKEGKFSENEIERLFIGGDWDLYDKMYGLFVKRNGFEKAEELFEKEDTENNIYQTVLGGDFKPTI